MEKKSRLVTILASLCGVLVVGMVAMGIVWAASTQTVKSTITVTYSVNDVVASVSANKYFDSNDPIAFTGGTNGTVTFAATDASTTASLTTTATTLTSAKDYVVYEYIFTNNSTTTAMNVSLTVSAATNLTVYVSAPSTTRKSTIYTGFNTTDYTASSSIAATTVAASATAYAYVAMKVTDLSADASFTNGTFTWTLNSGAASGA